MDIVFAPGTLTFKVIGGIVDLFVVVGPTPADVVAQYTRVIGRPHMIPYWVRACRESGRGPRSHLESANPRCSFLYPLTRIRPFCWFLQQVLGYHQYVRDEPRTARGVVKLTCARSADARCRWGYLNLDDVKEVVAQYQANNIPLDTMWTVRPARLSARTRPAARVGLISAGARRNHAGH